MTRIHILGASGSGCMTLGALLARRLGCPHLDSDDVFWRPTDPPYREKRPLPERVTMLRDRLLPHPAWVVSGSMLGWGAVAEPWFDLVVFLTLDPAVRMRRIRERERERYGPRIEPGGDMAEASQAFLAWAGAYDTAGPEQRSRVGHEAWLAERHGPVLRLDAAEPVDRLADAVNAAMGALRPGS